MTSTQKECDLRIVLLGKTGSGKSATGNTILGRDAFKVVDFIKSANKLCEKHEGMVDGKTISIIDTPGLFNTAVSKQQLKTEIEKCVLMSAPGPHVFLLVLKLGVRFTKEERDAVKWIQENFGDEALCRTIILFTHADQLKGKTLDEYIEKSNFLMEIVDGCGGRYHSFNNEDRNNRGQVTELLEKIDTIMQTNEMRHYTLEMFKTTQKNKEGKRAMIACGIAVLGIGFLGTVKITQMIAAEISGRAAGEIAVATTGEAAGAAAEKTLETLSKSLKIAVEKAVKEAVTAVQKAVAAAGKEVAEKAAATIEKSVVTAGEAVTKKSVATVEKAIETAGEAAANKAVAVIEAAAREAVQTVAGGTGVAAQGAVTVLAAAAAAGAARAAAAAGKVATSGRVAAAAAAAAAVGGAAVTLLSVLKP